LEPINDLNTSENKMNFEKCKSHINKGKNLFLFFYMNNCGHCDDTKKIWPQINEHIKPEYLSDDNIMLAQINYELFNKLPYVGTEPYAFPTIRHVVKKDISEYDRDRTPESFAKWIEEKIKKPKSVHPESIKMESSSFNPDDIILNNHRSHLKPNSSQHIRKMLQMGGIKSRKNRKSRKNGKSRKNKRVKKSKSR